MSDKTPYISVSQAIERLNGAIGKSFLYKLVEDEKLRHTRLGSRVLIDARHLEELLIAGLKGPAAEGPQPSQETLAGVEPIQPPSRAAKGRAGRRKRQGSSRIEIW